MNWGRYPIQPFVFKYPCTQVCLHTCKHTYTHTYMQIYETIHTYMCLKVTGWFHKFWADPTSMPFSLRVLSKCVLYDGHRDKIKWWNKEAALSRIPQSTTNWVVFRNGNRLEKEITTLRTCTNHPKSADFCFLSSNKKMTSIFFRKEPDCRHWRYNLWSSFSPTVTELFPHPKYYLFGPELWDYYYCQIWGGRLINFLPVGNINTSFF